MATASQSLSSTRDTGRIKVVGKKVKYSDVELADLHALDWPTYSERYPIRTFDAYRIKRNRTREAFVEMHGGATVSVRMPPAEDEWETLWSSLEQAGETRGDLCAAQETTEFVSTDSKPIGVCFLGDIHTGNSGVDYARLRQDLEVIRDTDGLYVCGMGDYIDNFKPQAKSGTGLYHSLFASPEEQLAYVTTRMKLAKGKWLCIAQGNHDAFDGKWAGIDRLPSLAQDLAAPYFSERGGTIMLHVGSTRYVIVVKHDYRGKSQVNKSNAQRRMWDEYPEWTNADVVCLAHLHEPDLHQTMRKGQIVTYLRTGTYKTHDEWAESAGYKPAYGVPLVVLYPEQRRIVAFHGEHFTQGVGFLRAMRSLAGSR